MAGAHPPGPNGQKPSEKSRRRVQVKVPEAYRPVNDEIWDELEDHLFLGFLTSPALVFGRTFVFKTLNHNELRFIGHLKPRGKEPTEARNYFKAAFIAHSIFLVDGENVLHRRADHMRRLVDTVGKLTKPMQDKLLEELGVLNQRAARLYPLTEVYVHENRSRFKWMFLNGGNTPVHSTAATGVAGTEELGMNYCQQTWVAVNQLTDVREQMDRDWQNAKFVGSCFNGKGVRSVDERDKARRERERTEREDAKMKVLHAYLNRQAGEGEDLKDRAQLPDGRIAQVEKKFQALSVDELAEQLSASLSGEKDHHDLVVDRRLREIGRLRDERVDMGRRIYSRSETESVFQASSVPIGGSSRVLGGRAEAEAQLARMRALQVEYLAKRSREIPGDLQSSDEDSSGESTS